MLRIQYATSILFCALAAMSSMQISCSSGPKPVAENRVEMPQNYPTAAIDTLEQLAASVPADADLIAFASYGSVADSIKQFRAYHIVDDGELDKLLQDLGTHYLLNPSSLTSFFKAGMDTGSGFVAGKRNKNVFLMLQILDEVKFRSWWDNFMNEEFGRPRYHESTEGSRKYVQIDILQKDFATLVFEPNHPVRVVLGSEIVPGSENSLETAKAMVEAEGLKNSKLLSDIDTALGDAPIGFWANPEQAPLPGTVKSIVSEWVSSICAGLYFSTNGPAVYASGFWKTDTYENQKRGEFSSSMFKAPEKTGQDQILSSKPGSVGRVYFDAEKVESFAVSKLNEKWQKQYANIKDMLTQRLLRLDVTDQVIHNLGTVWLAVYDTSIEPTQAEPSMADILSIQKLALFLHFKDASASNGFFGKISALMNILKSHIPQDMANVSQDGDLTHAVVKVLGKTIHVGYRNGILAVTTEPTWTTVKSTLENDHPEAANGILPMGNHFGLMSLQVADVTHIMGLRYPIVKEQIERFLEHFSKLEVQASANENRIETRLNAFVEQAAK